MKILINCNEDNLRVAIIQDGVLKNFLVEKSTRKLRVGNIYKARVEKVIPSLNASFLDLGEERQGFLPVEDFSEKLTYQEDLVDEEITAFRPAEKLKKGDEILVQVIKDFIGTKGPKLTTRISLPGRYLVLLPMERKRGISKRIKEGKERERLKSLLETLLPEKIGVIVRTLAEGQKKKSLFFEVKQLLKRWQIMKAKTKTVSAPFLLSQEIDLDLRILRDFVFSDLDEIVIDSLLHYKNIFRFLKPYSFPRGKIKFYRGKIPLFESEGVEKEIEKLLGKRVRLKSGGSIIIEETEALVSIDVNSGKRVRGKNFREVILKTNLEAAQEIVHQLKLRNLGGIIIIDFIDMESPSDQRYVHKSLEEDLEKDKAKINILQISKLGLVEMSRQRTTESINASYFKDCPYCAGTGKIRKE